MSPVLTYTVPSEPTEAWRPASNKAFLKRAFRCGSGESREPAAALTESKSAGGRAGSLSDAGGDATAGTSASAHGPSGMHGRDVAENPEPRAQKLKRTSARLMLPA
jgi:hypothetical protein